MARVRCPQCGTEFERGTLEFCPNTACGYPLSFIDERTEDPTTSVEMLRRPGERPPAPPASAPPTPRAEPAEPPPPPEPPPPVAPQPPSPPPPARRRWDRRTLLIVAGAATLVAVVVIIALVAFSGHHRTTTGTTGPTGPTSPTGQSGPTGATQRGPHLGDRTLFLTQPRMRGSDVLELQHDLDALGFHPGPIDGEFGPQTRDAVSRFQSCAGLSPSGIVDGPTASAILQALPGPMACPSPTPSSTLATSTGPTGPT